jgi:hypothetical protein
VPGAPRQWTVLAPSGDSPVYQAPVRGEALVRPESQLLHDTGPESLDQYIGIHDQSKQGCGGARLFQIHGQRFLAAMHDGMPARVVAGRLPECRTVAFSLDQDDLCAHVCEQHAAERRRADPTNLDDFYTGKWTHEMRN